MMNLWRISQEQVPCLTSSVQTLWILRGWRCKTLCGTRWHAPCAHGRKVGKDPLGLSALESFVAKPWLTANSKARSALACQRRQLLTRLHLASSFGSSTFTISKIFSSSTLERFSANHWKVWHLRNLWVWGCCWTWLGQCIWWVTAKCVGIPGSEETEIWLTLVVAIALVGDAPAWVVCDGSAKYHSGGKSLS